MPRLTTLTASLLAAAALAPAAALAATGSTELRGAPQMRVVDADTVRVTFVNDDKVARGRVVVADHGTATKIKAAGRHGDDFKYVARVELRKAMTVGQKYEVRIAVDGDETPAKRKVVLKPAR
jgi:endonuclease YncB( thermonuclease family)